MEEVDELELLVERVAGLDVGKAGIELAADWFVAPPHDHIVAVTPRFTGTEWPPLSDLGSAPHVLREDGLSGRGCSPRFSALFDAEQHAARHDKRRRLHDAHAQPRDRCVRDMLRAA